MADPAPALEPVLASAIADGAVEVIEIGSGRAGRDLTPPADPSREPERVEVAPQDAEPGQEAERAAPRPQTASAGQETDDAGPASALEHAQAVLESTLDSLGRAHHRPFSRE